MPAFPKEPFPRKGAWPRPLLRWYARHQRVLPWRRNRDPYRIMVSEFMLQQTRVETVLPYFERFLFLFPTLPDLARASRQKILKAWAGLGYYSRARNLHAAAQIIDRDRGGVIPNNLDDLLSLPGFGPYTAAAVASLAFGRPVAALDGNILRVLRRFLPGQKTESSQRAKKALAEWVQTMIPAGRSADFNQALMDLGALICLPGQPRCPRCPLRKYCSTQGENKEWKRGRVKRIRNETWLIALIRKENRYLLHQKEERGLLADLWQFPTVRLDNDGARRIKKDPERREKQPEKITGEERRALLRALQEKFGLKAEITQPLPPVHHIFTHLRVILKPFRCSLARSPLPELPPGARWLSTGRFSRYPISGAMAKIAALLEP